MKAFVVINYDVLHCERIIGAFARREDAEVAARKAEAEDDHSYSCIHETTMLLSEVDFYGEISGESKETEGQKTV